MLWNGLVENLLFLYRWRQKWLCQHSFLSVTNKHRRNFWGPLLSLWSWLGGGTFMLQHMTSSGRKSACLILVLWLCQPSWARHCCVTGTLRAPGAGSLRSDTRGFPREGWAPTAPVLCVRENGTCWNEPLPASHRWWGNEATLPIMLGFWSKLDCKLLLCILPSLDPEEEFKIVLGSKLFLKLLIKCFSENAEADELIKGKQKFLLYQEAQKMNVSLNIVTEDNVSIFFSVFETKVTYVTWTMMYYPKNQ